MCVHLNQVVMSFKIVSTATLMTLVLGKKLNFAQVCALLLLTLATAAVQFDQNNTSSDAYRVSLWGLALAFVYCLLSGLAGVVTEALLKGRHNASLHTSNTFLYSCVCSKRLLCYASQCVVAHPHHFFPATQTCSCETATGFFSTWLRTEAAATICQRSLMESPRLPW